MNDTFVQHLVEEKSLSDFLYFDLETSSEYDSFDKLESINPRKAELWKQKHLKSLNGKESERWSKYSSGISNDFNSSYLDLAPLSAEFGRIVCGSFCYLKEVSINNKNTWVGVMKSFNDNIASDTSEIDLILAPISQLFSNMHNAGKSKRLCGHNIKKFDIPWLVKRMTIQNISIPPMLHVWGKKPWELTHLDTGELWSLGDFGGYVSLDLLACSIGVPTSKDGLKGEFVGSAFHKEKKYEDIKIYCEKDVECVARICHRLSGSILPITFDSAK